MTDQPGYQPPGYQPPGYQPPGYQPPGYQLPGYQPPGYRSSGPQPFVPPQFEPQPDQPQGGQSPQFPPQWGQPQQPQWGQPQSGQPQWGQPQLGQPPQFQPQWGQQQSDQPQFQPQWGQPQWGQPELRPGCIPLRPLGLGDILDGAFRVISRNRRTTLGVSAAIAVVQAVLNAVFELVLYKSLDSASTSYGSGLDVGSIVSLSSTGFSSIVLSTLFGAFLTGLLTLVVTDDVLGRRTPFNELWPRVRPRLLRLVGLSVVVSVAEVVASAFCLVPGIWLWGIWAVAVPAFMVEGGGIRASLTRSRALVRGDFWRVWGIRALGTLIAGFIGGILTVPFQLVGNAVNPDGGGLPVAAILITAVGTILSITFVAPLKAGIDALLYTDLRMRKEGMDIALRERATSGGTSA